MGPREKIRELLSEREVELLTRGSGAFEVLFDLLEENGWDPGLVECATRYMVPLNVDQQGEPVSVVPREVWARLLGVLAKTDYPVAVERMNQIKRASRDYQSLELWVDTVNSAHCNGRPGREPTWQDQVDLSKMETITGEESNNMGPWEVVTDKGNEAVRQWTVDFAPEWMDHELQEEFGYTAQFKSVYYGDGGNFGPAFDATLRDKEGLWRAVRQFGAGNEAECPYMHGDGEDGNTVLLEQTYCGEHPGLKCVLCEGDLGEDHGVVYLGELGGAVFLLDVMASVTDIEIRELEGDEWEIVAFKGEEEVSVPLLDQRPGTYHGVDAAQVACARLVAPRQVEIHVVPLEDEE